MKAALKISLALIALTSRSYGEWHPYVGVGAALMKSQNSLEAKVNNIQGEGVKNINIDTTGFGEQILLGFRNQQKSFFICGEVSASTHQFSVKRINNEVLYPMPGGVLFTLVDPAFDLEIQQKSSGGVAFQVGKDLTSQIDVFFKFDLLWSQFAVKYRNSNAPHDSGQERKWLFGCAPGVGLEFHFTDNFSTRLDYSYKVYKQFKTKNISNFTGVANSQIKGTFAPRIHQFTLSLIYKF